MEIGQAKLKISAKISPGSKTNRPTIKMNVMIFHYDH